MKKIILILAPLPLLIQLFAGSGCKKTDNSPVSFIDSGKIYFHLHTNIDTNEVEDYGTIYTTSTGRKVSFTKAQLYLSDIQLVKLDDTYYDITNMIILQRQGQEQYYVATVPVGSFKSVRFGVGLDTATNLQPATADTALDHADMWLGATAQPGGYVFVSLQGSIDTTAGANGTVSQMQPFSYRLGTQAHYRQITMPDHAPYYTVIKGQITYVHIIADYNKLFTNVPLNNPASLQILTAAGNTTILSDTVSNNVLNMFSYEE